MQVWIIEGGERWIANTDALFIGQDRNEIEAEIAEAGHAWRAGSLFIALDTIRAMAGKGSAQ